MAVSGQNASVAFVSGSGGFAAKPHIYDSGSENQGTANNYYYKQPLYGIVGYCPV